VADAQAERKGARKKGRGSTYIFISAASFQETREGRKEKKKKRKRRNPVFTGLTRTKQGRRKKKKRGSGKKNGWSLTNYVLPRANKGGKRGKKKEGKKTVPSARSGARKWERGEKKKKKRVHSLSYFSADDERRKRRRGKKREMHSL